MRPIYSTLVSGISSARDRLLAPASMASDNERTPLSPVVHDISNAVSPRSNATPNKPPTPSSTPRSSVTKSAVRVASTGVVHAAAQREMMHRQMRAAATSSEERRSSIRAADEAEALALEFTARVFQRGIEIAERQRTTDEVDAALASLRDAEAVEEVASPVVLDETSPVGTALLERKVQMQAAREAIRPTLLSLPSSQPIVIEEAAASSSGPSPDSVLDQQGSSVVRCFPKATTVLAAEDDEEPELIAVFASLQHADADACMSPSYHHIPSEKELSRIRRLIEMERLRAKVMETPHAVEEEEVDRKWMTHSSSRRPSSSR